MPASISGWIRRTGRIFSRSIPIPASNPMPGSRQLALKRGFLMTSSSRTSSGQRFAADELRTHVRGDDPTAVEGLVRQSEIFNEAEIAIARELVDENLAKGEAASGYYFLFADGTDGIEGYSCFGPVPGAHRRFVLYWIAVHPRARRHGLGRRLQRATEDAVKSMGGI